MWLTFRDMMAQALALVLLLEFLHPLTQRSELSGDPLGVAVPVRLVAPIQRGQEAEAPPLLQVPEEPEARGHEMPLILAQQLAGLAILDLPQPQEYSELRTVLNVAQIHSGTVFNHKPETGWFSLDLRSLDGGVIDEMEAAVREILASVSDETAITFEMEPFQITPGGQIPGALDSDLVQTSVAISRHLGFEPRLGNSGSSNMNVAVGQGTLAIGLGGGRGGDRATPEEWADIPALIRTAKHVLLLALALR